MRILSFGHNISGCWWIRIKTPLMELAKKHAVFLSDGMKQFPVPGWQAVVFNNILGDIQIVKDDKVVNLNIEEMVEAYKKEGAKIIYDTDDAQDIHPHRGEYAEKVEKHMNSYFYLLKNADLITVTTEQLKKHIRQFTDRPIKVLPNCIDPELFPQRKQENKVKIGFAGSNSHIPDLDLVMPSIYKLKEKHDIYFETLGFQKDNCKWRKPVPINEYYKAVADLGADIGICPLLDNQFNINKSPLKFLEYSMVGTMVLASNRFPYKGEMKPEWLVDDDKWEETLEKFILDKYLREQTLKEQQEWVLANRNIKDKAIMWEEAYRETINNESPPKIVDSTLAIWNGPFEIEPMNEKAGELLTSIADKLTEKEIQNWWVSAGTALCLYRDGDFKKTDTDLDFAIVGYEGIDEDIKQLVGGELIRSIYDAQNCPMQLAFMIDGNIVDFYFHWRNDDNIENHGESGWTRMKAIICTRPQIIDTKYGPLPIPQEEYFEIRYGSDWKIPSETKPKFYEI